ncbi:MAG: hypothetical protein SRB2_00793 [Desulfobacteraceae bacterium Eth-SRB2]|nr:MAG: hypothetical protein SRB2_00793 [Desulfobacteraceae bacterium Eth-SRB2]
MKIDFTPYFVKYKTLATQADEVFARVQKDHPECVTCKIKCADCCAPTSPLAIRRSI